MARKNRAKWAPPCGTVTVRLPVSCIDMLTSYANARVDGNRSLALQYIIEDWARARREKARLIVEAAHTTKEEDEDE